MARWSADGRFGVVAGGNGFMIQVLDGRSGRCVHTIDVHQNSVYNLVCHAVNPRIIISGGYDGKLALIDLISGSVISCTTPTHTHTFTEGLYSHLSC